MNPKPSESKSKFSIDLWLTRSEQGILLFLLALLLIGGTVWRIRDAQTIVHPLTTPPSQTK